jgi:putative heme iron utilization protein
VAMSPILYTVPTTNDAVIIPWKENMYSLFKEARVLCYHTSCQNCVHLAIIFKLVAIKASLQRWKQITIAGRQMFLIYLQKDDVL